MIKNTYEKSNDFLKLANIWLMKVFRRKYKDELGSTFLTINTRFHLWVNVTQRPELFYLNMAHIAGNYKNF